MKNLYILLLLAFTISCNTKRPEPNFYKNGYTGEILNKSDFEEFNTAKCSIELTIISLKEPKSKFMASVAELVNIIFSLFVFIKFAIFNLAS